MNRKIFTLLPANEDHLLRIGYVSAFYSNPSLLMEQNNKASAEKTKTIVEILMKHEDNLSDGYHEYMHHMFPCDENGDCERNVTVPEGLEIIANEILSSLSQ